ncbi:MAG: glycosyltransferase family 4 protein [Planctomycetes bacterium]|nr:glycosyltransferase family 4 protein [Planctomycetota bacterium]
MRIGVYLGRWSLHELGGMGVYLQNLLRGVESLDQTEHELVLLVDRTNLAAARALRVAAEVVPLERPDGFDLRGQERRRAIRVRHLSYRSVERADAMRDGTWSPEAEAYVWGLDDAVQRSRVDLLYFSLPPYVKWPRIPVVLTLHDLKHLHRPQDHDAADLARRRRWARVAHRAALVYASYQHVRRDIVERLRVPADRTAVLPLACPVRSDDDAADAPPALDFDLPEKFVLLPAQLWPHKNHQRVVQAVAGLRRSKQLDVTVLCTGQTGGQCAAHARRIADLAKESGVGDLFRLLGFVDDRTLRALYRRSRAVLVASLYEPGSFPVLEALALGKPLAASRVTSLPETVGQAGLLFDPTSVAELADALVRLWTDDALCAELSRRGPAQLGHRSWCDVGRDWLHLCERAAASYANALETVA